MSALTILIADDHTLFRQGVMSLLEKHAHIKVIGEAATGQHALEQMRKLKPDLVILDISMPGLSGLDIIARIRKINPRTKVLILSMYENEEYLYRALKAGACGYVLKKMAARDLLSSIAAAQAGEVYLSPSMSTHVVKRYLLHDSPEGKDLTDHLLTAREREILRLLCLGKDNKQIAGLLDISYRTAQTHRAKIMKKLNVRTLPHLIGFAIRSGITTTEELMCCPE
ncbi:MAG: response regulator transcription factor [Thermodesulfobacteriota bacterium]|nr:response regulator transcription factor [Thermodesulfobacteriota bacterium]